MPLSSCPLSLDCCTTFNVDISRTYGKINHIVNNGQSPSSMLLLKVQYDVDSTIDTAGFTFDKMLHTTPDDAFDSIIKVHVRAPFRLVRQAAPYFRIKVR